MAPCAPRPRRPQLVAIVGVVTLTTVLAERGRARRNSGDARANANAIVLRSGHDQEEEGGALDFTSALESVWEGLTSPKHDDITQGCCKVLDAKAALRTSKSVASDRECSQLAKSTAASGESLSHSFAAGRPCSDRHSNGGGTGCCIMGLKDDRILAETSSEAECAKRAKSHEASTSNFDKELQGKGCEAQSTHEEVKNEEVAEKQGCCVITKNSGDQVVALMSNETCMKKIAELQTLVKHWSFDSTLGPAKCKKQDPMVLAMEAAPKGCCYIHFKSASKTGETSELAVATSGEKACESEAKAKAKAKEAQLEGAKYKEEPCQREDSTSAQPTQQNSPDQTPDLATATGSTTGQPSAPPPLSSTTEAREAEGSGVAESYTTASPATQKEAEERGTTSLPAAQAVQATTPAGAEGGRAQETEKEKEKEKEPLKAEDKLAGTLTPTPTPTREEGERQEEGKKVAPEKEERQAIAPSPLPEESGTDAPSTSLLGDLIASVTTSTEGAFVVDSVIATTSAYPALVVETTGSPWQPGCCVITLGKKSVKVVPADTPDQCEVLAEQDRAKADPALFKHEFQAGQTEDQCHMLELSSKGPQDQMARTVGSENKPKGNSGRQVSVSSNNNKRKRSSYSSSNNNNRPGNEALPPTPTPTPTPESATCCVVSIKGFPVDYLPTFSEDDCHEQVQETVGSQQVDLAGVTVEQKEGTSCEELSQQGKASSEAEPPTKFEEESAKLDLNPDRIEKVSKGTRKVNQMTNLVHSQMLAVAFWESKVKDERRELQTMEQFAEQERQKLATYQNDEQQAYKQLLADQNTLRPAVSSTYDSKGCCIIVANDDPDDSERTATPAKDEASCHTSLWEKLKGKRPYTATYQAGSECD